MTSINVPAEDSDISMITRWTRNAFLWRYPLFALLFEPVDDIVGYLGAHGVHGDSYFAMGIAFLLVRIVLLAGLLVFLVASLVTRKFRLALALVPAAVILSSPVWSGGRIGEASFKVVDQIRFHFVRAQYAAMIDHMSPQDRASTVVFFDWGESGFLSTSLYYWVVYDESGEIAHPDAERSRAWIERVRSRNSVINIAGCTTQAFKLAGHYYSATILCQ